MNNKVVGKILFYLFVCAAGGWTVWRSYHLLTLTFAPRTGEVITTSQLVLPLLGLAVFDGGCIAWAFWYRSNARGSVQRTLAFLGSAIDGLGVILASGFDYWLGGQTMAAIPPDAGNLALWTVAGFTAVNVAFIWGSHMFDPEAQDESAEQDVADEIRDEARKLVKRDKVKYARQYAPQLAQEIMSAGRAHVGRATNGHTPEQAFEIESVSDASLIDRLRGLFSSGNNGNAQTTHAAEVPAVPNPTPPPTVKAGHVSRKPRAEAADPNA